MNYEIISTAFTLLLSLLNSVECQASSLWRTCLVRDESFYATIIDADNLELGNREHSAIASVTCTGTGRRHSFSPDADGVSLLADTAVTLPGSGKICQGDTIKVQGDTCYILFLKEVN